MLLSHTPNYFGFRYDNYGANPSSGSIGTSVIPGISNAEGSWTQVASSADIAHDVYSIMLNLHDGSVSTTAKNLLVDIGVDPAGGTSYSAIVSNITCTGPSQHNAVGSGLHFKFPYLIKAGSSVAVRAQTSHTSAGTVRAAMEFFGQPSRPEQLFVGRYSETIGTITNSSGVSFTPGNAADGSRVSLGTTAQPLCFWQLCVAIDSGGMAAQYTYVDLEWSTDATNFFPIKRLTVASTSTEQIGNMIPMNLMNEASFCPVPAGATLYVRGRCNTAPTSGYNAVAIGIGG